MLAAALTWPKRTLRLPEAMEKRTISYILPCAQFTWVYSAWWYVNADFYFGFLAALDYIPSRFRGSLFNAFSPSDAPVFGSAKGHFHPIDSLTSVAFDHPLDAGEASALAALVLETAENHHVINELLATTCAF